MKTEYLKPLEVERQWWLVNASEVPIGRLASTVAKVLMGKHKTMYTPHVDGGDHVIIINVASVAMTGKKLEQKNWFTHSGYMGGEKLRPYKDVLEKTPDKLMRKVICGMLPKNRLGRQMARRLRLYAGGEHPHVGQKPMMLEVR